jgi:hypothetical protein
MTGGLLQIVTTGKQDIYLTIDPQITLFKKVYKRHTHFSIELEEIYPEQSINFNSLISFKIKNSNLLHRCYLQIDLPTLSFSDNQIINNDKINMYITAKNAKLNNLNSIITKWNNYYINLKNYVDIELQLYQQLTNKLLINNITIGDLKILVKQFNYNNKENKDKYKNNINLIIFNLIDITGYILSINLLISQQTDDQIHISINTINTNIKIKYYNIIKYLKYYNRKKNYYTNIYNQINQTNNQINFSYSKYLGHTFFEYFSIDIGGLEFQKYSNYYLHINQTHRIKQGYSDNYNQMIGNINNLTNYSTDTKKSTTLLIPLIFWFNKDIGSSLPLVAMKNSEVIISAKINSLKNIINFANYEEMFNIITNLDVLNNEDNDFILDTDFIINNNLIYSSYTINYDYRLINYKCTYINNTLLVYKFPDITMFELTYILTKFGKLYTFNELLKLNSNMNINQLTNLDYYLIDQFQWINFMLNINSYIGDKYKIASYYGFIDYNLYYSLINPPNIKLIGEFIYLNQDERLKFANSKLEYIIEVINESIYNSSNTSLDFELNINNPCKEFSWYIQPYIFTNGLYENGQNLQLLFDTVPYFKNDLISKQNITINQYDLLLENVNNNYYTNLLSYKYLNNTLPLGIYYYSFCLFPELTQPSGTINLRFIKGKKYSLVINNNFDLEYNNILNTININKNINKYIDYNKSYTIRFIAKCYDLLVINKAKANLIFSSS